MKLVHFLCAMPTQNINSKVAALATRQCLLVFIETVNVGCLFRAIIEFNEVDPQYHKHVPVQFILSI